MENSASRQENPFRARAGKRYVALAIVALAALVFSVYFKAVGGGFVWDDIDFIQYNGFLSDPANIPKIFLSDDAVGTGGVNPYYRPITTITFATEKFLWGDNPAGYHLSNILMHLSVCSLLFLAGRKLIGGGAAFVSAAIFAVHPANSEPVVYISARADLICAAFILSALLFFLKFEENGRKIYLFVSLAAFCVALLSKIVAMAFPLIILWHLATRKKGAREIALTLSPYIAVTALFWVLRSLALTVQTWDAPPMGARIATSGTILATFLKNTFFPFGLKVYRDFPLREDFFTPPVMASWALVAAVFALSVWSAKKSSAFSFGMIWYFAALAPVSGIITILYPNPVADRYLYIPLIGASLAVGAASRALYEARPSLGKIPAPKAAFALAVILAASYTSARVEVWNSDESFWHQAIKDAPSSEMPYKNYGFSLARGGKFNEAEEVFMDLKARGVEDAIIDRILSKIYFARGDIEKATQYIHDSITVNDVDPDTLAWYGFIMLANGNVYQAKAASELSLKINPYTSLARQNLTNIEREALE